MFALTHCPKSKTLGPLLATLFGLELTRQDSVSNFWFCKNFDILSLLFFSFLKKFDLADA